MKTLCIVLLAVTLSGCAGSCLDWNAHLSDCPAWTPCGLHDSIGR